MQNHLDSVASRRFLTVIIWVVVWIFTGGRLGEAKTSECSAIEHKPGKVEAWLSKRYEKDLRQLRKGFSAMGSTRVNLWVYPAENPSKIVAIGRCVPAYITRHTIRKAMEYSGGVSALVHQGFIYSHWIGIGTSLFAESSFQPITHNQFIRLMDSSLDTHQFQSI